MSLSRDELLKQKHAGLNALHEVHVPEWGGSVHLRPLKVSERDKLASWATANPNNTEVRKRLVGFCLCDETGKRLFADHQIGDLDEFADAIIDRLFEEAQVVAGIAENADGLEKNFETTPINDSDLSLQHI